MLSKYIFIFFLKLSLVIHAIEDGEIRLFGSISGNQGNVLIAHNGIWGSVCDDFWSLDNANVVCRSLGYSAALKATLGSVFGVTNHRIWLDNVQCFGNESRILDCARNEFGDNDCSPNELAGVHCKESALSRNPLEKKKIAILKKTTSDFNRINLVSLLRNSSTSLRSMITYLNSVNGSSSNYSLTEIEINNSNNSISNNISSILHDIIYLMNFDNTTNDTESMISQNLINLNQIVTDTNLMNTFKLFNLSHIFKPPFLEITESGTLGISVNDVFLVNGHRDNQGTILINYKGKTGYLCGETFTYNAAKYGFFGGDSNNILVDGLNCNGDEAHLGLCKIDPNAKCLRTFNGVAGVQCTKKLPDILLDVNLLRRDFYLQDVMLHNLQCAMEEFCLHPSAYTEILKPDGYYKTRRLLRFTAAIMNNGTAPFRPNIPKHMWQWHMCHMHFHSMDQFAVYQILDLERRKEILSGHKPSFCLEDNACDKGFKPSFACASFGEQGISPKCVDIYLHNIDCQWIDITGLKAGNYIFRAIVNPDMKVMELDFNNNAVECDWWYDGISTQRLGKCEYKKIPAS